MVKQFSHQRSQAHLHQHNLFGLANTGLGLAINVMGSSPFHPRQRQDSDRHIAC